MDGRAHQEVMFRILKRHVNGLVLQDDFLESNHILMGHLSVQLAYHFVR